MATHLPIYEPKGSLQKDGSRTFVHPADVKGRYTRLRYAVFAVLIAVIGYAAYSVLLRRRPQVHPLSFVAVTFAAGSLILVPFFAWEALAGYSVEISPATVLAIGYVAIFPSIVSYLCFNRGVELVGANRAGLFIHLMPVFGSLMAILFLGESFYSFHAFGILLIAAGIFLATQRR